MLHLLCPCRLPLLPHEEVAGCMHRLPFPHPSSLPACRALRQPAPLVPLAALPAAQLLAVRSASRRLQHPLAPPPSLLAACLGRHQRLALASPQVRCLAANAVMQYCNGAVMQRSWSTCNISLLLLCVGCLALTRLPQTCALQALVQRRASPPLARSERRLAVSAQQRASLRLDKLAALGQRPLSLPSGRPMRLAQQQQLASRRSASRLVLVPPQARLPLGSRLGLEWRPASRRLANPVALGLPQASPPLELQQPPSLPLGRLADLVNRQALVLRPARPRLGRPAPLEQRHSRAVASARLGSRRRRQVVALLGSSSSRSKGVALVGLEVALPRHPSRRGDPCGSRASERK